MIDLSNVTLLSINTHAPEMSVRALQYSSKEIKFKNKKILSNRIPGNLPDDIEFIQIPEFHGRDQYSDFVMNNLGDYVDGEFAMMIHDDGFVINPHLWTSDFLKYDYIGAPWPGPIEQTEGRVGNGGFCIRSKKLIEFCKTVKAEPGHDDWTIGVVQNEYLKEQGFTFAPVQIAMKFSLESVISECEFDLTQTFGFHGRRHHSTQSMINLLNEI
jgi:hypothetical protein